MLVAAPMLSLSAYIPFKGGNVYFQKLGYNPKGDIIKIKMLVLCDVGEENDVPILGI